MTKHWRDTVYENQLKKNIVSALTGFRWWEYDLDVVCERNSDWAYDLAEELGHVLREHVREYGADEA